MKPQYDVLYEEPGWYLIKGSTIPGIETCPSLIYHVCTQLQHPRAGCTVGPFKGHRTWVDANNNRYTTVRASAKTVSQPCPRCGLKPSEALQGLWKLHNWDWIQKEGAV